MNRIYGIGLSRTGTTSLSTAFCEGLGIEMLHFPNYPELFDEKTEAACDISVAIFYKELDKKFPGSKFIYTIRNTNDWLNSMERYIQRDGKRPNEVEGWSRNMRLQMYGKLKFNKQSYLRAYCNHDTEVRRYFKHRSNDLLIMNICEGDGWNKILPFLGLEHLQAENSLPEFPHENKQKEKS